MVDEIKLRSVATKNGFVVIDGKKISPEKIKIRARGKML